jgi:hypothetical protein
LAIGENTSPEAAGTGTDDVGGGKAGQSPIARGAVAENRDVTNAAFSDGMAFWVCDTWASLLAKCEAMDRPDEPVDDSLPF